MDAIFLTPQDIVRMLEAIPEYDVVVVRGM